MTRLAPADAIRFYRGNGMSRCQLERIYGREMVLRVLGNEQPPKPVEPKRAAFNERLKIARIAHGHGRPFAARIIGCSEESLTLYEDGSIVPRKTDILRGVARYMGERFGDIEIEVGEIVSKRIALRADRFREASL